ncbi:S-layer homology domain-containing protein [Ructibacterium gallinarum]|nr:S-layer homology domain-containing protein [Ructibacterium gallinarum]
MKGIFSRTVSLAVAVIMVLSLMSGVTFTVGAAEGTLLLTDDFGAERTEAITAKMDSSLLESAEKLTLHDLVSKDLINTPDKVLCQVLAGTNTADENISFGYKLDQAISDIRILMTGQMGTNGTTFGNSVTAVQFSADGQTWTNDLKVGSGLYLSTDEATMFMDPNYDALALKEAGLGKDTYTHQKSEAWVEYTLSLSDDGKAAIAALDGDAKYVRVKFIKGGKLWKGAIRKIDIYGAAQTEPEQPEDSSLLIQDTFTEDRTEAVDAKVYAPFTVGGPLKMWDVVSAGSETKPSYVIGKAMRGSQDAYSGSFAFGYETAADIKDFEITAWCGMNSNATTDNFNGSFILSTDASGSNTVTLTKGTDFTTTIVKEFDDFKGDGAMLEVEIALTDTGKEKLASQDGLRYWKYETNRARTWAGIFREVRIYNAAQTEPEPEPEPSYDWESGAAISISDISQAGASLSWPAINGASYKVTRTGGSGEDVQNVSDPAIVYSDLTANTAYSVSIDAVVDGEIKSTAPLTGSFQTLEETAQPEPEEPAAGILLTDSFAEDRADITDQMDAELIANRDKFAQMEMKSKIPATADLVLGKVLAGSNQNTTANYSIGYTVDGIVSDLKISMWGQMGNKGTSLNNPKLNVEVSENKTDWQKFEVGSGLTVTKGELLEPDYDATKVDPSKYTHPDADAWVEYTVTLNDDSKTVLQEKKIKYIRINIVGGGKFWQGAIRQIDIYGAEETEVFEHTSFAVDDTTIWKTYMDQNLSKNLDLVKGATLGDNSSFLYRSSNDLSPVEFVYSTASISGIANKNYQAFYDYLVRIAINGGNINEVKLAYSTNGSNFVDLTADQDYVITEADLQPTGADGYVMYELKASNSLPDNAAYFKITIPQIGKKWYVSYAGAIFNMIAEETESPSYAWDADASITVSDVTKTEATLSWPVIDESAEGITYRVIRTGGSGKNEQTVDTTSITYSDLLQGTSYDVSIEAVLDGSVVSSAPLTTSFKTEAPDAGTAFSSVFTFDNADNLLGGTIEYGWGDAIKEVPEERPDWAGRPQYAGLGAPTDGDNAFFEQHTLNIGTADEPEMVNGMGRVNETAKNKDGYIIYDVEGMTSFSVEFIMGNYNGVTPGDPIFYISDNEDYTSWTAYEKLNGVASQKDVPEDRDTYGIYTYISNNIPEGTKYLRIQFPRPTDAKAYDQVNIKKVKMNFNAEVYGLGNIQATSVGRNDVSIQWTPVTGADAENITYYLLQDYSVVDVIKGNEKTTYSATGLDRGVEYRYSLVAVNLQDDANADLTANYVELPIVTSAEPGQMVDQYKFPDNLLSKMDLTVMEEEAGGRSNAFTYDSASAHTLMRSDQEQAGVVVYHQPNMISFDVTLYLWTGNYYPESNTGDQNQKPLTPEFYVAGADKVFSRITTSPAEITIPGRYQNNDQTLSSAGALPEGTEYLKIVFGNSRVDCTKLRQVRINYEFDYAYDWAGEATELTMTEHTDTTAAFTWPELIDPPANYEWVITRNGAEVARLSSDTEHSYRFDDLTPGSTYSFGVQAVNKDDDDLRSSVLEKELQAYAREDIWGGNTVSFKDYTDTSVTMVLPAVPNATVQKYIIRDAQGVVVSEITEGNEYTITGLATGSEINYTVQAVVDQSGTTRYTSFLLARTVIDATLEPWPVEASISLTDLSESGVTIHWPAFENMAGRKYSISVNGTDKGTTEETTFPLTGLTPATTYDLVITVVDGAGAVVSHDLAVQFSTLRVATFYTDFRGSDLTYADTEDWEKSTFYWSAAEVPNVVHLNKVNFTLKYTKDDATKGTDPLGPVWGGFSRSDNTNAGDAYIAFDMGEALSEIVVRTQMNDTDKSATEINRPKIEYALDDGKAQSSQGSFSPNMYTWTEVDYNNSSMEIVGTTGEYNGTKRNTDNNLIETTVTHLPAGARYFKIYVPNVANTDKKSWRQWIVGVGGKLYDEVEATLRDYDFSKALTGGDTIDSVSHDVQLPSEIGGYRVDWISNNETLIGTDGKHHTENITNGYYGGEVTFTASIYRNPEDTAPVATQDYTVKVYKNTDGWTGDDFISYDLTQFTDPNVFTAPQPANALAVDVETPLPTGVENGSSFSWSIKEATENAKIEDGKLLITQKFGEDVPLTLVLTASKDGAVQNREYPINVIASYGTPISDGKIAVSSGSGKDNVKKPGFGTYWTSAADDEKPYIQYQLDGVYPFMTVVLGEVGDNVASYQLMISEDGEKWTTIYSGGTLGNAKQVPVMLAQQKPTYFRAEFTPKADSAIKIGEFLLFAEALSDEQVFESTFNLIDLPKTTTKDLVLPTEGINGAVISWASSDPKVISETGKVTRGEGNETVTLTATVTYNGQSRSEEKPVTVLGFGSSGGSSGGGGGTPSYGGGSSGGGSGSGSGLPYIPSADQGTIQPDQNPDMQTGLYRDITSSHWAYAYVKDLTDKQIVNGAGDGNFYPENSVTREEFLKMLLLAMDVETTGTDTAFADVDSSQWYAPYVATAYEMGIVKGVDETTFGIGQPISRQDMAVMADRMLAAEGITGEDAALNYTDASEIADYAAESVSALTGLSIMNGNENNQFLPEANATRAEAAKIVSVIADMAE